MVDLTEIPEFLRRRPKKDKPSERRPPDDHNRIVREDRNGATGDHLRRPRRGPENEEASDRDKACGD